MIALFPNGRASRTRTRGGGARSGLCRNKRRRPAAPDALSSESLQLFCFSPRGSAAPRCRSPDGPHGEVTHTQSRPPAASRGEGSARSWVPLPAWFCRCGGEKFPGCFLRRAASFIVWVRGGPVGSAGVSVDQEPPGHACFVLWRDPVVRWCESRRASLAPGRVFVPPGC